MSPLNSFMSTSSIPAAIVNVKESSKGKISDVDEENIDEKNVDIDFSLCQKNKLCDSRYHIAFAHPETLISSQFGRELLLSEKYQGRVLAIVVDEAHCISFRR